MKERLYAIWWFLRYGVRNSFSLRKCLDCDGNQIGWLSAIAIGWYAAERWAMIRCGDKEQP